MGKILCPVINGFTLIFRQLGKFFIFPDEGFHIFKFEFFAFYLMLFKEVPQTFQYEPKIDLGTEKIGTPSGKTELFCPDIHIVGVPDEFFIAFA